MISQLPRCEFVVRGQVFKASALLWTPDSTPSALAFRATVGRRHPPPPEDVWARRIFGWGCLVYLPPEFEAARDLPDDDGPPETVLVIEGNHWHDVRVLRVEANEVGTTIAGVGPPPYPLPYLL